MCVKLGMWLKPPRSVVAPCTILDTYMFSVPYTVPHSAGHFGYITFREENELQSDAKWCKVAQSGTKWYKVVQSGTC